MSVKTNPRRAARRQALAEVRALATHPAAGRQFCRKGVHVCTPAVTLTFDSGTRRLHWCTEHSADADQYRADADR